jgi:hypothetical protein
MRGILSSRIRFEAEFGWAGDRTAGIDPVETFPIISGRSAGIDLTKPSATDRHRPEGDIQLTP